MAGAILSILFARNTDLFISGQDIEALYNRVNGDTAKIQEWLCAKHVLEWYENQVNGILEKTNVFLVLT